MFRQFVLFSMALGLLTGVAGEARFGSATARWDERALTVGNEFFSCTYEAGGDILATTSLKATQGKEWVSASRVARAGSLAVSAAPGVWSPVGATGLVVRVRHGACTSDLYVWPGVPGVLARQPVARPLPEPDVSDAESAYRRQVRRAERLGRRVGESADSFVFASRSLTAVARTLIDQTDWHNELVETREWLLPSAEMPTEITSSTLDVRDNFTAAGLAFVRLAPMPRSRPQQVPDFLLDFGNRTLAKIDNGYPLATLVYADGEVGRIAALQAFQRALRPYRPGRDGVFLSNTWGDGNADARINQDFLAREIEAGAEIGVDVIQIDDGWQRGRTTGSTKAGGTRVWNGYWAADPRFWEPDAERFPEGLEPLVAAARQKGMRFGLWFGPDSSNDAANWRRDADLLLSYWRKLGVAYFKMDSLDLHSPVGFANNRRLFDYALAESRGEMVFDLDCTAQVRPGFLGLVDIGPVFVENRYARPNNRLYRPHLTLRSLWTLAEVIDPVRLRIELLNPGKGREHYVDDPFAPSYWPADALFAVAMTGSPLAWMELSDVAPETRAAWKGLVAVWKRERARWHGGAIFPVGAKPDGFAWTGFVSRAADGQGGYALLFRERNESCDFTLDLTPYFAEATVCEVIGGRGTATLADGRLSVSVPALFDFVWIKISAGR